MASTPSSAVKLAPASPDWDFCRYKTSSSDSSGIRETDSNSVIYNVRHLRGLYDKFVDFAYSKNNR